MNSKCQKCNGSFTPCRDRSPSGNNSGLINQLLGVHQDEFSLQSLSLDSERDLASSSLCSSCCKQEKYKYRRKPKHPKSTKTYELILKNKSESCTIILEMLHDILFALSEISLFRQLSINLQEVCIQERWAHLLLLSLSKSNLSIDSMFEVVTSFQAAGTHQFLELSNQSNTSSAHQSMKFGLRKVTDTINTLRQFEFTTKEFQFLQCLLALGKPYSSADNPLLPNVTSQELSNDALLHSSHPLQTVVYPDSCTTPSEITQTSSKENETISYKRHRSYLDEQIIENFMMIASKEEKSNMFKTTMALPLIYKIPTDLIYNLFVSPGFISYKMFASIFHNMIVNVMNQRGSIDS